MGTGTAAGAAVGGVGALLLALFMRGRGEGEGPGFFSSLFTIVAGALIGGLAGGYFKQDGPVFTPKDKGNPAPDGAAVVKRKLGLDAPPGSNKVVELDYYQSFRDIMAQRPAAEQRQMTGIDGFVKDISRKFRLLLKSGNETSSIITFTGTFPPGADAPVMFDTPVELPVKDGKVDYLLAGTLSAMRVAEKNKLAGYVEMPDLAGLKQEFKDVLSPEQQKRLHSALLMSALAKHGHVTSTVSDAIIKNAVASDGTLNTQFLEKSKDFLGIDRKHAVMFAPDKDNVNLALGPLDEAKKKARIDHSLIIDVKKVGGALQSGQLNKIADALSNPGTLASRNGLDLNMLSALSAVSDGGITYRKPDAPKDVSIKPPPDFGPDGQRARLGSLDIVEFNAAVRTSPASPAVSPAAGTPAPSTPHAPTAPTNAPPAPTSNTR